VVPFEKAEAAFVILSQSVAAAKNLAKQCHVTRFFGLRPQNDKPTANEG
jgi:hypothetical protein